MTATIWHLPRATRAALRIHQESTKRGLRRFSHRKKRNERAGTPAGFPPDDKRARTPAGFAPFLSFWSATAVARDRLGSVQSVVRSGPRGSVAAVVLAPGVDAGHRVVGRRGVGGG